MNAGAIAALAWLGLAIPASAVTGAWLHRRSLQRRTGGPPAPGAGQPPVPGQRAADVAASPGRPAPAPGPRHRTGGLSHAIRVYNCGCIHLFNRDGALAGCTPCTPASLDDEIKDLLT